MNQILVVGSVALDSVETLHGKSEDALGGSAVYFSLAARLFNPVQMVGVVGEDFPKEFRRMLEKKEIDVKGLDVQKGKTFRWAGRYAKDYNVAKTLNTQLNVFEKFRPKLSAAQKDADVVFLANIDPDLQWEVLSQIRQPKLVACDTMNFWIEGKKAALKELLSRVDVFFVNDEEARSLTGHRNYYQAARTLCEWGPSVIVIKKGEHGALLMVNNRLHAFPAYPLEDVKDPTGAGDSFAGGFLGYLAGSGASWNDPQRIKRACLYGSVVASFTVSDFSTRAIEAADYEAVFERYDDFLSLLDVSEANGVLDAVA